VGCVSSAGANRRSACLDRVLGPVRRIPPFPVRHGPWAADRLSETGEPVYDGGTVPVGDPMNPTPPAPDRRRCRRRLCRRKTLVTCLRGTSGLGRSVGVGLHDFSEEGVRLIVSVSLAPGEDVEVGLSPVYQSKAISVTGVVVWSAPAGGGSWAGIRLDRRLSYAQLTVLT
jgi:hypothetical protein